MKRIEYICLALFPVVFLYWLFLYRGHVIYWGQSGLFLETGLYFKACMTQPGGLAEYIGNFISQFYIWPVVGALVQTLLLLAFFLIMRAIVLRLGVGRQWVVVTSIPVLLLFSLQCYHNYLVGETLKEVFCFLLFWVYLKIVSRKVRMILFAVAVPLVFMLTSPGSAVFLYLALLIYEWKQPEKKGVLFYVLVFCWIGLWIGYPWLWQRKVWLLSTPEMYGFPVERFLPEQFMLFFWLSISLPLFLLFLPVIRKREWKYGKLFWGVWVVTIGGLGWYLVQDSWHGRFDDLLRLDQRVQEGDWEEAIRIMDPSEKMPREFEVLTSLSLAASGQLPDRLFAYPVEGLGALFLPRELEYFLDVFAAEQYYWLGMANEALHWEFNASVDNFFDADFRTLKRMTQLNIQRGDTLVARKYMDILSHSTLYKNWVREREKEIRSMTFEHPDSLTRYDYFVGGHDLLADLAFSYDRGRNNRMIMDYLLCGLLLQKDLMRFGQFFATFYPYTEGERIPKAYEEALLASTMFEGGEKILELYEISETNKKAYLEYTSIYDNNMDDKEKAKELLKKYKDTWWYYCHFVKEVKLNPRGMEERNVN